MRHSLVVYPIFKEREGRATLPELEKDARTAADMICKGLAASPYQSVSAPCLVVLPLWLHTFTTSIREIAKRRALGYCTLLRSDYHKVIDTLVIFANSSWTTEQKAIFESCTCQQHENPKVKKFENIYYRQPRGYKDGYGAFQEVVSSVFTILVNVIYDMVSGSTGLSIMERNPGKHGKWPSSPSKFIIHDGSKMVSACIAWAQFAQNSMPLQALSLLTFCCPSLALPMARNHDLLPLIASLSSRFIRSIQKLIATDISPTYKKSLELDFYSLFSTIDQGWFHDLIAISKTNKPIASALAPIYNAICDLLQLLHHFLDGSKMPVKYRLRSIAIAIYNSLCEATIDSVPESRHHRLIPHTGSDLIQGTDFNYTMLPAAGFASSVTILRIQLKCAHILCTETTESTKTNLKKCSGCQVVRYCSRTCQVGDWKEHKPACRPLKVLLPLSLLFVENNGQVSSDELTDSFKRHMSDGGLTGDDLDSITSYMISHAGVLGDEKSVLSRSWDGEKD